MGKISQNLSPAAVAIGALRVNVYVFLAATSDFQQCVILTSVDSDKPVQPSFKLRNSKLCSVSSLTLKKVFKQLAKALIRLCVCTG